MNLVVCIPSRGLMHSRTMDDVLQSVQMAHNVIGGWVTYVFAHGMPQPEAENYMVEKALGYKPDILWLIDDDMQFPPQLLGELITKMIETKALEVVAHYPVARNQDALHIRHGKFESAGMGCVLIRPEIFNYLEQPYFRTDTQYVIQGSELVASPLPPNHDPHQIHGGHDVDFHQRLLKAGITPAIIETAAGQYNMLDANVRKYGNSTAQNIETWILPPRSDKDPEPWYPRESG